MGRYEQPAFTAIAAFDGYEIRYYESYLVAETTVRGGYQETGSPAFRRLAGFIFGGNSEELKMNMTVPVTHLDDGDGLHRYRFVVERTYTEQSLPEPSDDAVRILRIPAGHYAAKRYRGSRSEGRYRRAAEMLNAALARDGVATDGAVASAVYDGPLVPAPLRRNEVLVPVVWSKSPAA